jgi:hypothetical protein
MHRSRCRQFIRYLEDVETEDRQLPAERTAVVEFVRSSQVNTFYSFSLEWGQIRDPGLAPLLRDATAEIPLQRVIDEFAAIQFYDACPPLPMLLEIVWGELFGRVAEVRYDERSRTWPVAVALDEMTEELQRAYGSRALHRDGRSCEFPKKAWVKQALDELVSLELAQRGTAEGEYVANLRVIQGDDLRSEFVRRIFQRRQPEESNADEIGGDSEQTSLPL